MEACWTGQTELCEAHGTWLLQPYDVTGWFSIQDGGRRDHLNIVDSSVCYNASALLKCGNIRLDTNILKLHPKGVKTFKQNNI